VTVAAASSLLASLVDYAGLFPPAQLGMDAALQRFAAHRGSREAWMLGRFVVPARRLLELAGAADAQLPAVGSDEPWRLSALLGDDVAADAVLAAGFSQSVRGRAVVDAVELKAATPDEIETALDAIPRDLTAYVELPLGSDLSPLLNVLRTRQARAKIRTGGVTPDALPSVEDVARFLASCADAGVAFKATAGLHHPVRADQPLTYEADGPRATMHGFLNVFAAAALAHRGASAADLEGVLREERATAFRFQDEALVVGERRLAADDLAAARADFAIGFGSCSFDEPVAGLKSLGML